MKEIFIRFLMASLGITKTEAEERIDQVEADAAKADDLFNLHKSKIDALKQSEHDNGYKKATKEVKFAFEKDLKEKFSIESDKKGLELVEELVASKTAGKGGETEISEDAVKKHPVYLQLETKAKTEKTELEKAHTAKLKELETAQAKKETLKTVSERAIAEFEKLNPILSENPEKAAKQKALIIKELEKGNYQVDEKGILILDEAGKRKEDAHGNALNFADHIKTVADDLGFDFKAAEDRSSSGGGQNNGNSGDQNKDKKFTGKLPTNVNEYNELIFSDLPFDQKQEVQQHWEAQSK